MCCQLHIPSAPVGERWQGVALHNANPFSRRTRRPRFANHDATTTKLFSIRPRLIKGGEAPKGASIRCPRHIISRCRLTMHRRQVYAVCANLSAARKRALTRPARLPALHRGACRSDRTLDSAQAVLHANERTQALPAPSVALKRSTPRAGRSPGGNDAQTARERGYKPRPQEPHSLHPTAVTGRRP